MAINERELPKSLYVSPDVHKTASIAAAVLGLKLKEMTEMAIADFIAKNNIVIPAQSEDLSTATN
jgi:hypothetical protein